MLVQTVCKIADLMTDEDDYLGGEAPPQEADFFCARAEFSPAAISDALKLSSTDMVIARRVVSDCASATNPERPGQSSGT